MKFDDVVKTIDFYDHIYKQLPSQEMIDFFEARTKMHIGLVQEALQKIIDKVEFMDHHDLRIRMLTHDISKFEEPERTPYIWLTHMYKMKKEGIDFKYPEGIESQTIAATTHHVKTNRHHPEFHYDGLIGISIKDRDTSDFAIDAVKMNRFDVAEMVADWVAMSVEKKTNTARQWFEKCSGTRWNFHSEQMEFIDKLLKIFEK